MALSTEQKWALGIGLGTLAFFGAVALAGSGARNKEPTAWEPEDEDDVLGDLLPPGRSLELDVLEMLDGEHPRRDVLDNATFCTEGGTRLRPDAVVLEDDEVVAVHEAKDVAELRSSHVLQAFGYDMALEPREGTTVDVGAQTQVPQHVADLADALGILLQRLV